MGYVTRQLGALLNGVAADAAESVRTTSDVQCNDSSRFRWTASLSRDSATALTIDVYASVDGGSSFGLVQSQSVSSGSATLSDYQQSKAVSGDVAIDGWIDCLGATHVRAVLSATSGTSSDLITFKASLAKLK